MKIVSIILILSLNITSSISFAKNNAVIDQQCASENCDETLLNRPFAEFENSANVDIPHFNVPPEDYKLQKNYSYLDPKQLINKSLLDTTLKFYEFNLSHITNTDYMTIIDFNQHSSKKRLYLVNMKSGEVFSMLVAAGVGSDPDGDGWATDFANIKDSKKSSLGFYLTAEDYIGVNGRSLRLHGLSETNSLVFERFIVVHGADYVSEADSRAGRSFGCPAVDYKNSDTLISLIQRGSLMYISYNPI